MKHLLTLIFIVLMLAVCGQAKIGMSPTQFFTPTSATTSSSTVSFGSVVSIQSYVKNYGNAVYSGSVAIIAKRDTLFGARLDSNVVNVTLLPQDSVAVSTQFFPIQAATAFKVAGNGNTIVVWPLIISGQGAQGDSVRATVWVNEYSSVVEINKNSFSIYPNPVVNDVYIKTGNGELYSKIMIYDVFARKVKEMDFKERLDVSDLNAGSYWIIISSEDKSYRSNFIKQ